MKSPEQMGGQPEQPKEEQMKDKERELEKPATPEFYDEAEWNKLKQGGEAFAINKGREMGVPQKELDRFAEEVIAREAENQNYGFVYRFRKNMSIGTKEEIRAVGERAYQSFFAAGEFGSATAIAEDVYGRDSEEWKRASEAERKKTEEKRKRREKKIENEEQKLSATISKEATFADLFNAIDAIEEEGELGEIHFEEELLDNFDAQIAEEILAFRDAQANKAATTKVLDFFKERGCSQSDVSAFLPIRFKQERKKKQ